MSCYVNLNHVMSCYVNLNHVMSCYVNLNHVMLCYVNCNLNFDWSCVIFLLTGVIIVSI